MKDFMVGVLDHKSGNRLSTSERQKILAEERPDTQKLSDRFEQTSDGMASSNAGNAARHLNTQPLDGDQNEQLTHTINSKRPSQISSAGSMPHKTKNVKKVLISHSPRVDDESPSNKMMMQELATLENPIDWKADSADQLT